MQSIYELANTLNDYELIDISNMSIISIAEQFNIDRYNAKNLKALCNSLYYEL